jgi:hypothetical protein
VSVRDSEAPLRSAARNERRSTWYLDPKSRADDLDAH